MIALSGDALVGLARSVSSRDEFVKFTYVLVANQQYFRQEWENSSLDSFLQGLSRFAKDMDGYYQRFDSAVDANIPNWRLFAEMLLAARVYE